MRQRKGLRNNDNCALLSQKYIRNHYFAQQIHLSNVIQFSRENQFCDLGSNKQQTAYALAQCTTAKAAINFALKEKLNLLLLVNDSDLILEAGICGDLFFFFIFNMQNRRQSFVQHRISLSPVLKCSGRLRLFTEDPEQLHQSSSTEKAQVCLIPSLNLAPSEILWYLYNQKYKT